MKMLTTRRSAIRQLALFSLAGLVNPRTLNAAPLIKGASLIPVMITPFKKDKSIDWATFDRLTDFYLAAGADGYFANCLSSEMYVLEPDERLAVTERVIRRIQNKPIVSSGSFGETLQEKADFIKKVYDLGTEAVILITGHLAGKNESDEILIRNLEKLTSLTGNIPLGTYEAPNPYKRVLTRSVIEFMAGSGRFIYHKDTSENMGSISEKLATASGSKLSLYNAHTATAVASIRAGGAGLSPISANFYPEILNWICDYAGDVTRKVEVDWIQSELAQTEPIISQSYPLSSKYFLMKRGLPVEQVTRVSRNPLNSKVRSELHAVHKRFLGWCDRLNIRPVRI